MEETQEYAVVSKNGTAVAKALVEIWERIGKPEHFDCLAGRKMLEEIARVYEYFFRQEFMDFLHDRAIDLKYEKPIYDLVKQNHGITPISYPPTLFNLIKAIFPDANMSSRETQKIMFEVIPYLKTTNTKV